MPWLQTLMTPTKQGAAGSGLIPEASDEKLNALVRDTTGRMEQLVAIQQVRPYHLACLQSEL